MSVVQAPRIQSLSSSTANRRLGVISRVLERLRWRKRHAFEQEAAVVVAVSTTGFLSLALGSFTPIDPSSISATFPASPTRNLGGEWGAEIAAQLFFQLGLAAWCIPAIAVFFALILWNRHEGVFRPSRMVALAGAVAVVSSTFAMLVNGWHVSNFEFAAGGALGGLLAAWLAKSLGDVGAKLALVAAGACCLLYMTRSAVIGPTIDWIKTLAKKMLLRLRKEAPIVNEAAQPTNTPSVNMPSLAMREPALNSIPSPSIQDESPFARAALPQEKQSPMFIREGDEIPELEMHVPSAYNAPPLNLFQRATQQDTMRPASEYADTGQLLIKTLADFGVTGKIVDVQPGPVVTVFEFQPDAGIKLARVMGLIDDLALALRVDSIFINPVKGKQALGIQVPNVKRDMVLLGDILGDRAFAESPSPLTFAMGKSLSGDPVYADLATMPHLLAAGATGSGKSVAINTLLCSIIMKSGPEDVKMILVDPKMLELSVYEGIPHLLMPVITEPARASLALKWAAHEMERRYRLMQIAAVRHISGFNAFWEKADDARKEEIRELMGDRSIGKLSYILLVIDELADLMLTAPKDVESSIQRLAQKARASGIHLVLATQRPSVDIITGVIKANLPCRISFQVVSKHDSRTILDMVGAEKLLGKGDMLFQRPGGSRVERIHGAFVADQEVIEMVSALKARGVPRYDNRIISWIDEELASKSADDDMDFGGEVTQEPKFQDAIQIATTHGMISASFLQRHLKIGYNRAARIVEAMEARGMVAKADGAKPRRWLGQNRSAAETMVNPVPMDRAQQSRSPLPLP